MYNFAIAEIITYPALWKLAAKYYEEGIQEIIRSFSKKEGHNWGFIQYNL